jgi:two-component system phosphate regulon sensor histidine kinase PhoR
MVTGDPGWLERCLLNLLDNAIKYTPHGGRVRVCVSYDGDRARVDVRDTGIGMAPGVIPHIFERFYRGDPARSSTVEGAGLGLSLVKWIVDRHEGRIEVQSGIGRGSSFAIWLPAGSVS